MISLSPSISLALYFIVFLFIFLINDKVRREVHSINKEIDGILKRINVITNNINNINIDANKELPSLVSQYRIDVSELRSILDKTQKDLLKLRLRQSRKLSLVISELPKKIVRKPRKNNSN